MDDLLLFLLFITAPLERFHLFVPGLEFSLKPILLVFPWVFLVFFLKTRNTPYAIRHTPLDKPFLGLLSVEALSAIFAFNRFKALKALVFHTLGIGLVYLLSSVLESRKKLRKVLWFMLAAGFLVSIYGGWQFLAFRAGRRPSLSLESRLEAKTLPPEEFVWSAGGKLFLRPSSTFIDTNTAGGFLASLIPLSLGLGFLQSKALFFLPALLLSFFLTLSRSAFFGLVLGLSLFFFLLWSRFGKLRVKLIALASLAALLTLFLFPTPRKLVSSRVLEFVRRGKPTTLHIKYARAALRMFKDRPLLGVGPGNYEPYYLAFIDPQAETAYSHSAILEWLAEGGTLGFLSHIYLLGTVFYISWHKIRSLKPEDHHRLVLVSLFSGYLILCAANIFYAYFELLFVWLYLGVLVATWRFSNFE